MKKLESVLKGYQGCGKSGYLAIFPQIFWGSRSPILPLMNITMKVGEGKSIALANPIKLTFRRQGSTGFDITLTIPRRSEWAGYES